MAAIDLTGSAEEALVPVFLRITHWTKSGLPVSPPGLFPPCFGSANPPVLQAKRPKSSAVIDVATERAACAFGAVYCIPHKKP